MDYATLHDSNPGALAATAQVYRAEAERWTHYADDWRDRVERPAIENWTGQTASRAEAHLVETEARMRRGQSVLVDTAEALDEGAMLLGSFRDQLRGLSLEAKSYGWVIGDDGSVSRSPWEEPATDPVVLVQQHQQQEAIEDRIRRILDEAGRADADLATRLRDLNARARDAVKEGGGGPEPRPLAPGAVPTGPPPNGGRGPW
ncbi:hypothetical protein [Kitasatospora cinereorecta]|uniref:Uncharacterized protein n=1 Tax=Kitasatospora cinereorecta TaxID=285560 RepID=A0ABW0VP26_9ACTN